MHTLLRFSVALWLASTLSAIPMPVFACTQPVGGLPQFSIADHVKASDIVVEGFVTATTGQYYPEVATIQVSQYLKGSGPDVIIVKGYSPGSQCGTSVYVEMHAIFYIRVDPSGAYHALQLSQSDAAIPATPEYIREAIIASGQEPVIIAQATFDIALTRPATITSPEPTSSATPSPYTAVSETPTPPPAATDTFVPPTLTFTPTLTAIRTSTHLLRQTGIQVIFLLGLIILTVLYIWRRRSL